MIGDFDDVHTKKRHSLLLPSPSFALFREEKGDIKNRAWMRRGEKGGADKHYSLLLLPPWLDGMSPPYVLWSGTWMRPWTVSPCQAKQSMPPFSFPFFRLSCFLDLRLRRRERGGGCPFGNWDSTLAKKSTNHTVRWISPFSGEFLAYNFQLRYFGQEMLSFPLARLSLILSN